jgi:hypothetical protein
MTLSDMIDVLCGSLLDEGARNANIPHPTPDQTEASWDLHRWLKALIKIIE